MLWLNLEPSVDEHFLKIWIFHIHSLSYSDFGYIRIWPPRCLKWHVYMLPKVGLCFILLCARRKQSNKPMKEAVEELVGKAVSKTCLRRESRLWLIIFIFVALIFRYLDVTHVKIISWYPDFAIFTEGSTREPQASKTGTLLFLLSLISTVSGFVTTHANHMHHEQMKQASEVSVLLNTSPRGYVYCHWQSPKHAITRMRM